MQKLVFLGSALVAVLPAMAQPTVASSVAPPETSVLRPPAYRSVFADYRPWRDPKLLSWRAANDDAGALGGHMGQLRGSAKRTPDETATTAPPSAPPGPAR